MVCWGDDTDAGGLWHSAAAAVNSGRWCQTLMVPLQKGILTALWGYFLSVVWTRGRLYNHGSDSHLWGSGRTQNHLLPAVHSGIILCRISPPLVCFLSRIQAFHSPFYLFVLPLQSLTHISSDFLCNLNFLHLFSHKFSRRKSHLSPVHSFWLKSFFAQLL